MVILLSLVLIRPGLAEELPKLIASDSVISGAEQIDVYLPLFDGMKIGVMANQSSLVGNTHLVDTLLSRDVEIVRIFTPEHGFRGDHAAGAHVQNAIDEKSGISLISLYGNKKRPDPADMEDIDLMLVDLQDVGVRFYTYISSLTYMMEVCAQYDVPLVVLDRPNPNGFYIDGPVLEPEYKSFVGLHPVPVVYGLTIGEYALMINGEGWLSDGMSCQLEVVGLKGYERNMIVELPERPSPNLPDWRSVYLYPSLCFFEGTIVSVGRGTTTPFQIFGHPDYYPGQYVFTPKSSPGAGDNPKLMGQTCYGELLTGFAASYQYNPKRLHLDWLIEAYNVLSLRHDFFNNYFNTLAGTSKLREQIEQGLTASAIRRSWQEDIENFKKIRSKYLIYPDIE